MSVSGISPLQFLICASMHSGQWGPFLEPDLVWIVK